MAYGYHSQRSVPSADPVQLRDGQVHITLPAGERGHDLSWHFPLHGTNCCKKCGTPTTFYVGAAMPRELLACGHLISLPWDHGFWRCIHHVHGFVLIAPAHPYTVGANGWIHGTCDCHDTETGYTADLPAASCRIPNQPARCSPAPTRLAAPLPDLDQSPPPVVPSQPMEPIAPFKPTQQLALF